MQSVLDPVPEHVPVLAVHVDLLADQATKVPGVQLAVEKKFPRAYACPEAGGVVVGPVVAGHVHLYDATASDEVGLPVTHPPPDVAALEGQPVQVVDEALQSEIIPVLHRSAMVLAVQTPEQASAGMATMASDAPEQVVDTPQTSM